MATVKFRYSAMSNISFNGEYDTGIEAEEWAEMSEDEQSEEYSRALFDLVEIWVDED